MSIVAVGWVVAALFPGAAQGFCIGCAVFFVMWAGWIWHYGVHVTRRGVTVATILRPKRVPWSEVERFEVVRLSKTPYAFAVIKRGERRMVVSMALCTPRRPEARVERYRWEIQTVVDELNQILADTRARDQPAVR